MGYIVNGSQKTGRSLAGIAGIVAIATLVSKVAGLVRQQAIAAAFGVGAAIDAYNYAYVIPGFLLVLLGGINGPFHSAMVSVLSKRERTDGAQLVETITTLVCGILLIITCGLVIFAEPLTDLVAPGLGRTPEGLGIRAIAIQQFRIMAPLALLSGLIGIGFGTLNAADSYWLPSISPLFSSFTLLLGLGLLVLQLGSRITLPEYALQGGLVLAWGTLGGALLQWLVQVPAQWRAGMGTLRLRFNFRQPAVQEVLKVMAPATFSSGMLQINVYTDLFFASFIPQAAAAMGYAGLLVQTPLGILSNVILVPLLPVFSRLADPRDWAELKDRIRQGMILTAATMLPLSALMIPLADPIVRVVYERFAFDRNASQLVTIILVVYSIGMFVYLGRDVLVRVFYGLGDGETPFRISVFNIFLNALLDYLFVHPLGAPGLILATVGVNLTSMVMLLWALNRKLGGLPWLQWIQPLVALFGVSLVAGLACWSTSWICRLFWGTEGFMVQLLEIVVSGTLGLGVFVLLTMQLNLPEVNSLGKKLRQKLGR